MKRIDTITDIPGIKVGHAYDLDALTGCTVILCEMGATGGVDQRGGAPGTRETDLLRPVHLVQNVHGVLLAGGSAFGLDAAAGVMQYLEEIGVGYETGYAKVPIVPAMVLYDLNLGRSDVRPDKEMGYQACLTASNKPVEMGNFGAGCGASVGKASGINSAMKSGIGSACIDISNEIKVGAIFAVNPFGDIIEPGSGNIIAGTRKLTENNNFEDSGFTFSDSLEVLRDSFGNQSTTPFGNTIIGVVATNAYLTKEETNKVAEMAHDGLSRTVRPAHTMLDGDTIIALSTGKQSCDVNVVGAYAAEVVTTAILRSIQYASSAGGLPSMNSFSNKNRL